MESVTSQIFFRLGGIQVHIIKGKVHTEPSLGEPKELAEGFMNEWTAVVVDEEWRFVDVNFASRNESGGDPGSWELIDDNGKARLLHEVHLSCHVLQK